MLFNLLFVCVCKNFDRFIPFTICFCNFRFFLLACTLHFFLLSFFFLLCCCSLAIGVDHVGYHCFLLSLLSFQSHLIFLQFTLSLPSLIFMLLPDIFKSSLELFMLLNIILSFLSFCPYKNIPFSSVADENFFFFVSSLFIFQLSLFEYF